MKMYKEYCYFKDKDGLWKVLLPENQIFIVALDDSKEESQRKIVWKNNSEETCKRFIDWKCSVNV